MPIIAIWSPPYLPILRGSPTSAEKIIVSEWSQDLSRARSKIERQP
jgi:hypothetical protein